VAVVFREDAPGSVEGADDVEKRRADSQLPASPKIFTMSLLSILTINSLTPILLTPILTRFPLTINSLTPISDFPDPDFPEFGRPSDLGDWGRTVA
jgi:hypothetical protein